MNGVTRAATRVRRLQPHEEAVAQPPLQIGEPLRVRCRRAELRDRRVDDAEHVVDLARVLDARRDLEQAGIAVVRRARVEVLDDLLVEHEPPIRLAGLAEREVGEEIGGDARAVGGVEDRQLVGQLQERQRLAVVGDVDAALGRLLRLDGNLRRNVAALPAAVVLLDQCEHVRRRHIAGDEEHGVVGAVVAAEEGPRILVQRRHDRDIALVAERRVAVRMALERGADELLVERELGVRARLAILAVDGAGLGLERGLGVRQASGTDRSRAP